MADVQILFTGPMVRALLDGRKTRRKIYARRGQDPADPSLLAKRLANGLDEAKPGQCWVWKLTHNGQGYGTLRVRGRTVYAHRLAYELSHGPVPDGLDVMHACDNPACINPEHLTAGSRSQNMADCYARGRSRIPAPRMRGEANGAAKLTAKQVAEIRRLLSGRQSQQSIADRFGVSQALISKIKLGRAWV